MKRINQTAQIILLLIFAIAFIVIICCEKETPKVKVGKLVAIEPIFIEPIVEENIVETNEESNNEIQSIVDTSYTTRMTSYYPEESSDCTGSGLCSWDFDTNENGWYTYNGKLVIATASNRLGYTEMKTYNLYDEIVLNIDGIDYDAVVLDVCGACMRDNRIDLFVSGSWAVKDTMIEVKEMNKV